MTVATPVTLETSLVEDARSHRSTIVAVALMIMPVIAAAVLLGRPLAAVDLDDYAAVEPVRNAYWLFSVAAAISMGITYVATGLAGCPLYQTMLAHPVDSVRRCRLVGTESCNHAEYKHRKNQLQQTRIHCGILSGRTCQD
jgi:hypothetical protein